MTNNETINDYLRLEYNYSSVSLLENKDSIVFFLYLIKLSIFENY